MNWKTKQREIAAVISGSLQYSHFFSGACTLKDTEGSNERRHKWAAQQKRCLFPMDAHATHAETSGEEMEQILTQEHNQK